MGNRVLDGENWEWVLIGEKWKEESESEMGKEVWMVVNGGM